MIEENCFGS